MPEMMEKAKPFLIGGASGMIATCFIQPIDMVKVLLQVQSEKLKGVGNISVLGTVKTLWLQEGIRGFYRGIDSALARQFFYTTVRLGTYKTITAQVLLANQAEGRKQIDFYQRVYCAAIAGLLGSFVGTPADLALIRMQADSNMAEAERRNYRHIFDAFLRIFREEGVTALWRGGTSTMLRAVVLNLTMLSSYDEIKDKLQAKFKCEETMTVRLCSSMLAGSLAATASLPFDNAKTKLQKMKKDAHGNYPYKNIFDAMQKTVRHEGVLKLWVGLFTFVLRIAPHACITLVLQDKLTDFFKQSNNHAI